MTRNEYIQLLSEIPENIRKEYGFNEPFDYSKYKCIHTDEYDYYPDLDCCIIDDTPIVWESGNPWVTPENPKILEGFKNRVKWDIPTQMILIINPDGKIDCQIINACEPHLTNIRRKGYTSFINTPDGKIYYNPNQIDLPEHPETIKLARCLFWAQMHEVEGVIPDKDEPVEEWWPVEFM